MPNPNILDYKVDGFTKIENVVAETLANCPFPLERGKDNGDVYYRMKGQNDTAMVVILERLDRDIPEAFDGCTVHVHIVDISDGATDEPGEDGANILDELGQVHISNCRSSVVASTLLMMSMVCFQNSGRL